MWKPVTGLSLASQHAVNSQQCKCSQSHMRTFNLFCDLRSHLGNGSRITEMSHSMSTDKLTEFLLLFYYLCLCLKKASGKSKAAKPPDGCFLIWSFACMRVHTCVCMCVCMYVCLRMCVHAHMCVNVCACSVCVCTCMRVRTHLCVCVCPAVYCEHVCLCTGLPFSYRYSCSLRVGVGHTLYRIIF